ncbi:hypothetical protein BH10BAC2_BH10BAC2_40310 [soil metagenome]
MWNYFPVALQSLLLEKVTNRKLKHVGLKIQGMILLHTEQSVQVSDTTKA